MQTCRSIMSLLLILTGIVGCQNESAEQPAPATDNPVTDETPPNGTWEPIWDGESFDGWHTIGGGQWTIEDAVIVGHHGHADRAYGHLVSDSVFSDFDLRFEFLAVAGNSGLCFRSVLEGPTGVSGLQAEIHETEFTGGLWETNGRGWVSLPRSEEVETWFRPGEWNSMQISAHGTHVRVWVNGLLSAQFTDDDPRFEGWSEGHFAVQLHADMDVEIRIRDIEMMDL